MFKLMDKKILTILRPNCLFILRPALCFLHQVLFLDNFKNLKIVSEHDQEIPQSQTADKPMAPRGRATQQSQVLVLQFLVQDNITENV